MDKWLIISRNPKPTVHETPTTSGSSNSGFLHLSNCSPNPIVELVNADSQPRETSEEADSDEKIKSTDASENNLDSLPSPPKKPPTRNKSWKPKLKPKKLSQAFAWIDETKLFPFCKACNTKVTGGIFHLKRHAKAETHQKLFKIAKENTTNIRDFVNLKTKLHKSVQSVELKFCCFICENNLPFLLMDTITLFCKNVFPDSTICDQVKLKRKKTTQLVVSVLAPYFKNEIFFDLRMKNFTLIIDETTDISTKKSLIILVRYWKDEKVVERILDLVEVESATANALFLSIKKLLDENSVPYKNIIAFASDNANTMMGDKNGVQAKLKEIAPHLYVQGCLCHSLHLATSAAAKELPSVVEQFARDIYAYFAHSSKRLSELGECQAFAQEKPHKLLYPSQTRWLSLRAVVDRILEQWNSLTLFFQRAAIEDNLPTAKAILNALKSPNYKLYFLFLLYVLNMVIKINVEMQSAGPKFPILLDRFASLFRTLLRNFIKIDVINRSEFYKINLYNPSHYLPLDSIYCGAKVEAFLDSMKTNSTLVEKEVDDFKKYVLKFYIKICNEIKCRFNFEDRYLKFAANFAPSAVKSKSTTTSIAVFINLFPQIQNDIEEINTEWRLLLDHDLSTFSDEIDTFWKQVGSLKNSLGIPMFGNLMKYVVENVMILAHSSASAERGFSSLNLNKTEIRNRLNISTCSAILIVKDKMKQCGGAIQWEPPQNIFNYMLNILPENEDIN